MIAQIYLAKGAIVPKHSHENEQITYILEGRLRSEARRGRRAGGRRSAPATCCTSRRSAARGGGARGHARRRRLLTAARGLDRRLSDLRRSDAPEAAASRPLTQRRPEGQQLGPVLVQPVALRAPVGAPRLDELPEPARVVRLAQVAELVHDDVVEHVERREHEAPVERERAARRARAPARALVADLDARRLDADRRRLLVDQHRDELARRAPRLRPRRCARGSSRRRGRCFARSLAIHSRCDSMISVDLRVGHPRRDGQ